LALFKRRAETGKYQKWFNLSRDERDLDKKAFQAALDAYKKVKGIGNWKDLDLEDKQKIVSEILDCLTYMEERLASGDVLAREINKDVAGVGCTVDQAFKTAAMLVRRQDIKNYGSDRRRGFRTVTYKQPTKNTGGGGGGGGGRRRGGNAFALASANASASASAIAAGGAGGAGGNAYVSVTGGSGYGEIHGYIWHSPATTDWKTRRRVGVHGAFVYLIGTDVESSFHAITDRDGFYRIRKIVPGHYTMRAERRNPLPPFAPYGYIPNETKDPIRVREDKDQEWNLELEAIWREREPPKKPKPGYHIISPKESRKIGPFRFPFYKRPHEGKEQCPGCGKRTLVEEVDEKTGKVYFRCANKDCPVFLNDEKLTPDQIGIGGRKIPITGLNARERANKRLVWEDRMSKLRKKYRNDELTEAEFETEKQKIENEVWGGDSRVSKGWVTRVGGPLAQISRKASPEVTKGVFAAAIIGIGAVISSMFGNWWFFAGFLSIGLYVLTPSPESGQFQEGPMGWGHILPWAQGGTHAGFAWIKSITKVTAIITFAYGFSTMGDIFNTFFVAICLIGYFMLKREYDPKRPGDFIESLLRFGILGCYFIPFYVFASIFNSYVLAAISLAFFAIPPMPKSSGDQALTEVLARGLSGQTAYYEMFDKILFLGLMGFALLGSGSLGMDLGIISIPSLGWQLTGTLKATFIYFWIISLIGGFFSPARERPLTGILFLGGATIIYAVGPGSQDVGSALLGQWWPSVNQAVTSISEPISKMFGTLGKTFGDAFLLLTNPVGYATQLMNGSYANNPVGETGAYGVELSGFDVSPVFIAQPFMITANIKNSGAYDAQDVKITFTSGAKAPEKQSALGTPSIAATKTFTQPIKISQVLGTTDGCKNKQEDPNKDADKESACVHYFIDEQNSNKFIRQNIWQTVFSSSGITCSVSAAYELRKKYMPINVTLNYKYQSDSKVSVEFISQAEWDRLAKLDQLNSKLQFVQSQFSSAPVKFPIGTPGLKNPILETQDFHVALNIMSDQVGGKLTKIETIELYYPTDFELASDGCSPSLSTGSPPKDGYALWEPKSSGDQIFYCHFQALKQGQTSKLGSSPTKTYILNAHAIYTYSVSKQKDVKVEFGSWCCDQEPVKDSCASGTKCCREDISGKGICIPQKQTCELTTENCGNFAGTSASCYEIGSRLRQSTNNDWECMCSPSEDNCQNCYSKTTGKQP